MEGAVVAEPRDGAAITQSASASSPAGVVQWFHPADTDAESSHSVRIHEYSASARDGDRPPAPSAEAERDMESPPAESPTPLMTDRMRQARGKEAANTSGTEMTALQQQQQQQPPSSVSPDAALPPCSLANYFRKWGGQHAPHAAPMISWSDMLLAFVASFFGIGVPALLHFNLLADIHKEQFLFIIASFGATAVLLYSAPMSDFSQPRNVVVGHTLSAFIGVCVRHLIYPVDDQAGTTAVIGFQREWLACALAVSLAIVAMNATKTVHPPGGATALQAVLAGRPGTANAVYNLDFKFIGFICAASAIMTFIAIIFNNLPRRKTYPKYWI